MGGLTVSSLNFKWFIITCADDQTVAKVGSRVQGWPWALSRRGLPAPVQEGPPLPQVPCSEGFPAAVRSCLAALPALAMMGAHRDACYPPISPTPDQRCCNKSYATPSPRRQKLRAMLTNFMGSPHFPEEGLNHASPSAHHPAKMPPRASLSVPDGPDLLQVC